MAYVVTPNGNQPINQTTSQIRGNFAQANTSFGTDHYSFDNGTVNNGFHIMVTNPDQGTAPVTSSAVAISYGLNTSQVGSGAPIGLIQFSRGPSNATPTPLTSIHGTIASLTTSVPQTILDLTGLTRAIVEVYALADSSTTGFQQTVFFNGTTVKLGSSSGNIGISIPSASPIIQLIALVSNQTNVYWTVKLLRIS